MPSHFAHLLFAEETLRGALGETADTLLAAHGNLLRFGAQGPDLFYHNQRTMPTGLRYGIALHRHGYGAFVGSMLAEARRLSMGPSSELGAFILGFTTHAALDRRAHPFINYFSGGTDEEDREQRRQWHAHPFFERVLDVLVLRERAGLDPAQFDFLGKVRCGKTLPYPVVKAMVKGLHANYPAFSFKSRDRKRVDNAYHDAMFFYKLTNHLNPDLLRLAFRKDTKEGFRERRLALLHPRAVPAGYDFLNAAHAPWCHPCSDAETWTWSFLDLWEQARADCVRMLGVVHEVLAGRASPSDAAAAIGPQSLETGRDPCPHVHTRPLPLREILEGIYREIAAEAGPDAAASMDAG